MDIESLNQKGQDLAKDAQPADQVVVKEPLSSVNRRWDNLLEGIGERQVGKKTQELRYVFELWCLKIHWYVNGSQWFKNPNHLVHKYMYIYLISIPHRSCIFVLLLRSTKYLGLTVYWCILWNCIEICSKQQWGVLSGRVCIKCLFTFCSEIYKWPC